MSSRQHLVCLSRTECQISFCVRIDSFICEVLLTLTFLRLLTLAHMTTSSMSQTMWKTHSGWNYFRLNWWKAQILYHSQSFTVEMGWVSPFNSNEWVMAVWVFFFHQKGQHVTGTAWGQAYIYLEKLKKFLAEKINKPGFNSVRTSTRYWIQEGIIKWKTLGRLQVVMCLFYTKSVCYYSLAQVKYE